VVGDNAVCHRPQVPSRRFYMPIADHLNYDSFSCYTLLTGDPCNGVADARAENQTASIPISPSIGFDDSLTYFCESAPPHRICSVWVLAALAFFWPRSVYTRCSPMLFSHAAPNRRADGVGSSRWVEAWAAFILCWARE